MVAISFINLLKYLEFIQTTPTKILRFFLNCIVLYPEIGYNINNELRNYSNFL